MGEWMLLEVNCSLSSEQLQTSYNIHLQTNQAPEPRLAPHWPVTGGMT